MLAYQGTWVAVQKDGSTLVETWKKTDKNHIQVLHYQVKDADTTQRWQGSFYYSKFIRFVHQSSIHLHIDSTDTKDTVYPFILDTFLDNRAVFSNFNNPFPHKIIYDFAKRTEILVRFVSKDALKE